MFHNSFPEVQQVTKPHSGEFEIRQELLLVCIVNSLDGLQFQNDLVFNNDVSTEPLLEADSSTCDGHRYLTFCLETPLAEFVRKDDLVNCLQ